MLERAIIRRRLVSLACCAAGLVAATPAFSAPGDLDPSFGEGGEFVFQANPACHPFCVEFGGSYVTALALQRDGKIVLGGNNNYIGAHSAEGAATALVRVNPNGTLDTTFAREGLAAGPPFSIWDMGESVDGRLFTVGGTDSVGVEQYTEAGTPMGVLLLKSLPMYTRILDTKLDSKGRILILLPSSRGGLEVRRFLTNGAPDRSFGVSGIVRLRQTPATEASAPAVLGVQRDGRIMVVASIELSSQPTTRRLFFVRLTPRGKLDD